MATSPLANPSNGNLGPFIVAPIQAKLNRIVRNGLMPGFPVAETGSLNPPTVAALQRFRATFAIDSAQSFAPWIGNLPSQGNALPFLRPAVNPFALPPPLLPQASAPYDPLPDLDRESVAMQVLQWLVDHSEGSISQMTPAAHLELAKRMLPHARQTTIEQNTPYVVKELICAQQRHGADMDHTGMLLMSFATIAAETQNFVPIDEGVNRRGPYNNTAYEDFDVYEPYFKYDKDGAEERIRKSREEAMKKPNFHEPVRRPTAKNRASDGNTEVGDGARFKGRGLIQLTHREGYKEAGKALQLDLLEHPEKLNTIEVSAQAMVWFFQHQGRFQKIQRALSRNNIRVLREVVNGVPKHGDPAGLKDFETAYWTGKRLLGEGYALMVSRLGLRPLILGGA